MAHGVAERLKAATFMVLRPILEVGLHRHSRFHGTPSFIDEKMTRKDLTSGSDHSTRKAVPKWPHHYFPLGTMFSFYVFLCIQRSPWYAFGCLQFALTCDVFSRLLARCFLLQFIILSQYNSCSQSTQSYKLLLSLYTRFQALSRSYSYFIPYVLRYPSHPRGQACYTCSSSYSKISLFQHSLFKHSPVLSRSPFPLSLVHLSLSLSFTFPSLSYVLRYSFHPRE
jgi:hypothetical protein